jgi:hypothetical protein
MCLGGYFLAETRGCSSIIHKNAMTNDTNVPKMIPRLG